MTGRANIMRGEPCLGLGASSVPPCCSWDCLRSSTRHSTGPPWDWRAHCCGADSNSADGGRIAWRWRGRLSGVWQALLDIRDARQENRLVLVPRVSAENIFVPVVRGRAVLHDVGGCLHLSWEFSCPYASDFPI